MARALRSSANGTTNGTGKLGAQGAAPPIVGASPVKSDVRWFAEMVQARHPDKPGTILHLNTGVNERLCQKYAAGSVRPSSAFLRALLRSENGWIYLQSIMHGSDAPWWLELQQLFELGRRFHMRGE